MQTARQAQRQSEEAGPLGSYTAYLGGMLETQTFSSKGVRTRFRLKLAAAQGLEEAGFQDLKVSDICARAGLALGTFYVYFQDKSEIAGEVLFEFADEIYRRAQRTGRGHSEFESILLTNRFFLSAYQANPGLVRCLMQIEDQLPEFRSRWRARRLQWTESIARSISRRSAESAAPRDAFLQIAYALEGMVFHYLYDVFVRRDPILSLDPEKPEEVAELLSILWYRAVYCENPPADQIRHARAVLGMHRRASATVQPPGR